MSKGQHRGPVHCGIRWRLHSLWTALWIILPAWHRIAPQVCSATPAETCQVGLTIEDVMAAATTNYPIVEPCPWGLSAGACAAWHPSDHVSRYINA